METNKLKRILALILVCLMLTPIVSFATADTDNKTDSATEVEDTDVDDEKEEDSKEDVDDKEVEEAILTEKQRHEKALEEAVVADIKDINPDYKLVTDNGTFQLFLNEETLGIIIRDMKTGAIMKSVNTAEESKEKRYNATITPILENGVSIRPLLANAANRFSAASEQPWIGANAAKDVKIAYNDNGFVATVKFETLVEAETYSIEFDLNVTLNDRGLTCEIPEKSIKETDDSVYAMGYIYIYPLLGYTDLGDRDGYMILPDGNGIMVEYENNFNDTTFNKAKYKSAYTQPIYGQDYGNSTEGKESTRLLSSYNPPETIVMPIFGQVHTDTKMAVLGVVEEGAENAIIEGNMNGVNRLRENYATVRFIYRDLYLEPTSNSESAQKLNTIPDESFLKSCKVTFLLTSGDDATYAGLARAYREKLIEEGNLTNKDTSYNTRVDFLGSDKKNFLVFKETVTMTTIENIREIFDELKDEGVTDILSIYKGWQDGGIYSVPVTSYDADRSIGGTKELTKLVEELEKTDVKFYLGQDAQTINPSMVGSTFNSIKKYTGLPYLERRNFEKVFNEFKILYPEKSDEYLSDLTSEMLDDGLKNVALEGISNKLFSYTQKSEQFTRLSTANVYKDMIESIDEKMSVVLKNPFDYYWKNLDAYLDTPIYSSMFVYTTQEIPFLTTVLKGSIPMYSEYTNFEANKNEFLLKLVEFGVFPSFYITYENPSDLQETNSSWVFTSEYAQYKDEIVEYHKELKEINDKIGSAYIANHEILDNEVHITTYENGVKIYTNYSKESVIVDGLTIDSLSYKVGGTK